jgi:site-specific DNA-methyltransferase (cytosine-N4-specific)
MLKISDQAVDMPRHPAPRTGTATAEWMPYRLFPYERRLGVRELESLGAHVLHVDDEHVVLGGDIEAVLARTTYFRSVTDASGATQPTAQAAVEERHHRLRAGDDRRRQATRYGVHGLHEYKGRFNPQLVRSICNAIDPHADVLIDPFCGSGTSLIEGLRLGVDVVGIDRSPMAWFLSETKIGVLAAPDKQSLVGELQEMAEQVAVAVEAGQDRCVEADLSSMLSKTTVSYLRNWFTEPAFCGLSQALSSLHPRGDSPAGRLGRVAISSLLRQISNQLPEDLRIRRRPKSFVAPPIAPLLRDALEQATRAVEEIESWDIGAQEARVLRGRADDADQLQYVLEKRRRLIVTSPPYATALPYIDTDRLSIAALGLAESGDLMTLERALLGSREWTRRQETEWNERRKHNSECLPPALTELLARIEECNREAGAGFRRQAVPSLLYRYFAGMGSALAAWRRNLEQGEFVVLIVGRNRTTAGDERFDIATPQLLAEVASSRGYSVMETIPLETWPRYGLHAANGVAGEDAVVLQAA